MTRVTITLETPLAEALRAEALREDRPVSSVARRAFARYFTAAAQRAARSAGAGTGAAAQAAAVPPRMDGGAQAGMPQRGGGPQPGGGRAKAGARRSAPAACAGGNAAAQGSPRGREARGQDAKGGGR